MRIVKLLLLILVGTVLVSGTALAVAPIEPFLPFYYVRGTVTCADPAVPVAGLPVAFYKDFSVRVMTVTDSTGHFELNPYELAYYYGVPVNLETESYQLAVCRTDLNLYGTEESVTLPASAGFLAKDLTIVLGGGPYLGPNVPAGTVPLIITRDGTTDKIKLNWDPAAYPRPQIFVQTGNGTGQFANRYDSAVWTKIAGGGSLLGGVTGFSSYNETLGTLLHDNQFGTGSPEVYYKALKEDINITTTLGQSTFESAWAVGKANVQVTGSYSLMTMPFTPQSGDGITWTLQNMFGSQITEGELQHNPNGLVRVVCSGGTWPAVNAAISKGFWIKSTSPVTCTLMGGVLHQTYERTIIQGYDLYGNPYPVALNVTSGSRISLGIDPPAEGDVIQLMVGGGLVRYSFGSGGWGSGFNVNLGKGYWYQNPLATPRYFRISI